MKDRDLKCNERIDKEYERTMQDIREFIDNNDYDGLWEYGLSMDYVEPGTFDDQREGYFRWQLSWGGPSDEFRLYDNNDLEYWFLDWFDGDCIELAHEDYNLIFGLLEEFRDMSK